MTSVTAHRHGSVLDPGEAGVAGAWARASLPLQSSPTLARVHRATMRLEGLLPSSSQHDAYTALSTNNEPWMQVGSLNSPLQSYAESSSSPGPAIKRGVLLTLRPGAIFRRWRERYFMLTRDYFSCFKIVSGGPTPMGAFIYKVRLAEVTSVTWINSRSDALGLVTLELGAPLSPGEEPPSKSRAAEQAPGRACIQLRAAPGVKDAVLEDWFELIEECVESSKSRRAERTASINRERPVRNLHVEIRR